MPEGLMYEITMIIEMDEDKYESAFGVSGDVDRLINPEYYTEMDSLIVEEI